MRSKIINITLTVLLMFGSVTSPYAVYADTSINRPADNITVSTLASIGRANAGDEKKRAAGFYMPQAVFGGQDLLYVADTYNNLICAVNDGKVIRVSGSIKSYDEYRLPKGFYRDGDRATALFNRPMDGLVDKTGRIFICDAENHAIRLITGDSVHTYAGGEEGYANGILYNARFNHPSAIAMDKNENLYIADTLNHCIRKISANGTVTTLAGAPGKDGYADGSVKTALFNSPSGIAVSEDGKSVYVSDTGNHCIRLIKRGKVVTLAGSVSETDEDGEPLGAFADGKALEALFNLPVGLAYKGGVLVVADSGNHRIRAITRKGEVITLAGSGEPGDRDGYAADAAFNLPMGVHIVGNTLYIADTGNNKIKQMPIDAALCE